MTTTDQAIANEAAGRPHNAGQEQKSAAKHRATCMCHACIVGRETVTAETAEKYGLPVGTKIDPTTKAVIYTAEEVMAQIERERGGSKKKTIKAQRKAAVVRALTPEEQEVADLMAKLQAAQEAVKKQRADETAYAAAQRKAAEAKQAELAAEAERVNPPIQAQIDALDPRIAQAREILDALVAEQTAFKNSLVTVPTVQELLDGKPASTPRTEGAPKVNRIREDGSKAWETPIWLFWKEYQRIYKNKDHSHRLLNEMAKKTGLNVADRSAQNMARMHDYMTGKTAS